MKPRPRSFLSTVFSFLILATWIPTYLIVSVTGWGILDWTSWHYWYGMRKRGRYLKAKAMEAPSALPIGTIIIDTPSPGLGLAYVWWTEDDIVAVSPVTPPNDKYYRPDRETRRMPEWHPFDRWVFEHYLDWQNGKAYRIGIWDVRPSVEKIRKRFPSRNVIRTWSGCRWIERGEIAEQ